jgi:hypothetical protein
MEHFSHDPTSTLSPREQVSAAHHEQAAQRLRERLSCAPFYAKKAAAEKARSGDEMAYWRGLHTSAAMADLPPEAFSTADPKAA